MTEQVEQVQAPEAEIQPVATSAATLNTEAQAADGQPGPVPYERFKEVNAQLKAAQKLAEKLQSAQKEKERAEMTELERVKAEVAERDAALAQAQTKLKEHALRDAFRQELATQKLRLADGAESVAFRTVDLSSVELDDDGKVNGMDAAVKALAKGAQFLFRTPEAPPIDGSAGTGSARAPVDAKARELELTQRYNIR